jgi:hypothetical protein
MIEIIFLNIFHDVRSNITTALQIKYSRYVYAWLEYDMYI